MSLTVVKTDPIDPHMQLLGTLYLVLRKVRLHGLMSIEEDIERPEDSEAFSGVSGYDTANEPVYTFVRDVLRLMVGGNLNSEEIGGFGFSGGRRTWKQPSRQITLRIFWCTTPIF